MNFINYLHGFFLVYLLCLMYFYLLLKKKDNYISILCELDVQVQGLIRDLIQDVVSLFTGENEEISSKMSFISQSDNLSNSQVIKSFEAKQENLETMYEDLSNEVY